MTIFEMQEMFKYASKKHLEAAKARTPIDAIYWQGRKDSYRTIMAIMLSDDGKDKQSSNLLLQNKSEVYKGH